MSPSERNEEWTKMNFIAPLLDGLGWDRMRDVRYEHSPEEVEGALDFVLVCKPSIGIEAKALDVKPPDDRNHSQIKKGLKQSKERGASYFIWTNGDCWQFFSLDLQNAPLYEVIIGKVNDNAEEAQRIASKLSIIEKKPFTDNPQLFDEHIREHWKAVALPAAVNRLLKERAHHLIELIREDLPSELRIEDVEMLEYVKSLKPPVSPAAHAVRSTRQAEIELSFPKDWEYLLDSFEPLYERARNRFRKDNYRKLGEYLVGEECTPWSKKTTWRYVGASSDIKARKRLGTVISLFKKWNFIESVEKDKKYKRVEESIPYLKRLLDKLPPE